jgi:hypothetical protein
VDEGDEEQARKVLRALLQQPDDPDYLPECREQKAKARALLKELE